MEKYLYIALFAPLVSSLFSVLFTATPKKLFTGIVGSLLIIISFLSSSVLLAHILETGEPIHVTMMTWMQTGGLYIPFGFLVDQNGSYVLNQNKGKIAVDSTKTINVTKEGEIYQEGKLIAKLGIVQFDNVKPVGNSYYSGAGNSKNAKFSVLQGHLENSNVNAIESMIDLINSQRRFEMYGNLMRSLDQIEQRSNEIGRA